MTTQLDRLEALAESDTWDFEVTVEELRNALPDLIRVARAAWHIGWNDDGGKCWCSEPTVVSGLPHDVTCSVLRASLAPLYREVES